MAQTLTLLAPLSGIIVPLDKVPDPVFAQRLIGDGISIDPVSQELLAPCDAQVVQVHRAGHAVTLAAHGLEIVIHIGLDTVNLKGEGFTPKISAGAHVRAGDPLIVFDADLVAQRARSLLTEIVVTNMEAVATLKPRSGKVAAGHDAVLHIELRSDAPAPARTNESNVVESDAILIASATGLHARPAALVASTARRFVADVRLMKSGQEANARSVVSIMALEVLGGDRVHVIARGEDASAAVQAISEVLARDISHAPAAIAEATAAFRTNVPLTRELPASAGGALRGVPAAPGVAVGQVYQLRHQDPVLQERAADPNQERRSLEAAIASAHVQLEALQGRLAAEADADRAAIFAAHQELLEDPEVLDGAADRIRDGSSAAYAWRAAYTQQAERLLALDNQLLAARAADMRDVGRRVLHLLVGHTDGTSDVPPESIIVAEDLVPSEAASFDRARVRGFCTTMGSATSHVAIIARGLGIPAVAGIDPRALELAAHTPVILDGDAGTLQPSPSADQVAVVARKQHAAAQRRAKELAVAAQPAVTREGHRVEVVANIGDVAEAKRVVEVGGEGVGLLRTEFLFMDRQLAPDEDEQTRVYEEIARALGPDRILVIRTLDVGGDKPLSYLPVGAEANPFLGERGIRLLLNHPDVLRAQMRAILRASNAGRVAMMFPMISTIAEWRTARQLAEVERRALGVASIQIGIMVETASAALMAERFAVDADFFSIGTNDLTQYTLAMDRTNPRLASQVDALHPAVLRLIEVTVAGARKHKRWVGVCGALAGDPVAVPILIGLGIDELSVSVPAVPAIKARVRTLSMDECRVTANEAVQLSEPADVRALVARRHGEIE
jgi:phosphoenolpyruvate-protein phosphotransferase